MGYLTAYVYEMDEQFYYEIYKHEDSEGCGEFVGRKGFETKKECAKKSEQKILEYLFDLPEENKPKKTKKNRYPRAMRICQNCIYGDNKKGKYFKDGWNVFCNNKGRFFRWDKRKICFKRFATATDLVIDDISVEIKMKNKKRNEKN